MTQYTRRDVLSGTVGAAGLLAGCSESDSSSGFTRTAIEGRELVVEFEESLEAETIAVVDPAGESFAETDVSTGVSRVTFEISMPYTPGEYLIVASDGEERIADTTQVIQPELEIVDVGVGANRMDEMPEELHYPERQVLVGVQNTGTGPGGISKIEFEGFPTNTGEREGSGLFDQSDGMGEAERAVIPPQTVENIYSTTLPFAELASVCESGTTESTASIELSRTLVDQALVKEVVISYSSSGSTDNCKAEFSEVSDA